MIKRIGRILKRSIKTVLEANGVADARHPDPGFPITNNQLAAIDEFYRDDRSVDDYLSPERLEFYKEVAALVERHRSTSDLALCDVGCGAGALLKQFDKASRRVGLDFSEAAVAQAKRHCPRADFQVFDVYDTGVSDRFDIVLCTEVLEHLLHPTTALRNLAALVEASGLLVLTVPNGRLDTFAGHINFWSPESWPMFLEDALPHWQIAVGQIAAHRSVYAVLENRP
jgi:SAM-dependent methyltransferase